MCQSLDHDERVVILCCFAHDLSCLFGSQRIDDATLLLGADAAAPIEDPIDRGWAHLSSARDLSSSCLAPQIISHIDPLPTLYVLR
jgi:hypothetical protein